MNYYEEKLQLDPRIQLDEDTPLEHLKGEVVACRLCPRLVSFRESMPARDRKSVV
jgi:hypothetical protein